MLTLGPLTFTESKLALRRKGITATTDSARMFPLLRFETMKIRQTVDPLDKGKIFSFSIRKFTVVSRPFYVLTFSHFICCSLAFFFFFSHFQCGSDLLLLV